MLRTEQFSSRKSSVLPISRLLLQSVLVSPGFDSESAYGALCKSIDCQAFEGFARQLHNCSFEKKKKKEQPSANRKIQEPSEKERFLHEQWTGELERVTR